MLESSDVSISTEVDGTLSETGSVLTAEIVVDDEFDKQSTLSDIQSIGYKHTKSEQLKHCLKMINKLKNENLMLHDSLLKANAVDIAMLRNKLRGSITDISILRQHNGELKDRVQILESKLFNALSQEAYNTNTNGDKVEVGAQHTQVLQLRLNIKTLTARCDHLSRLSHSYEKTIESLHKEVNSLKKTNAFDLSHSHSSSTHHDRRQQDILSSPATGCVPSDQALRDQKTIMALSDEVRRLAALVPLRPADEKERQAAVGSREAASSLESSCGVSANREAMSATDSALTPARKQPPSSVASSLTVTHLLVSFVLGALVMLLCSMKVTTS